MKRITSFNKVTNKSVPGRANKLRVQGSEHRPARLKTCVLPASLHLPAKLQEQEYRQNTCFLRKRSLCDHPHADSAYILPQGRHLLSARLEAQPAAPGHPVYKSLGPERQSHTTLQKPLPFLTVSAPLGAPSSLRKHLSGVPAQPCLPHRTSVTCLPSSSIKMVTVFFSRYLLSTRCDSCTRHK